MCIRDSGVPVLVLQRPVLPEVDREFGAPEALWQALLDFGV